MVNDQGEVYRRNLKNLMPRMRSRTELRKSLKKADQRRGMILR